MLQTSEPVRTETQHSAVVAQQGAGNAEVQVQRLASFRKLMLQVTEQAAGSQQLSRRLAEQIQREANSIRQAFADA